MYKELSAQYWEKRYQETDTPWDIGDISPPLRNYFNRLGDKELKILIPGAGRAYEAIYLHQHGFRQVFVCDWAESSFEVLKKQAPDFPATHLLTGDFFDLTLQMDLIIEQTFFCALPPAQRPAYVNQMANLLKPKGKLVGLLFAQDFQRPGPPFGGTESAYRELFKTHFDIKHMAIAPDSIKPRLGRELFFIVQKRQID